MDAKGVEKFINEQMEREFPLKRFRDRASEVESIIRPKSDFSKESLDGVFGCAEGVCIEVLPDQDFKQKSVKIAGFGGQGVLSMGLALAQAAFSSGRFVSWYPDYGPEQRGGTSNCSVVISGGTIGSPVVDAPDVLVAFNKPSLDKFASQVKKEGLVLFDSSAGEFHPPEGVRAISIPATKIAAEKGAQQAANTAMLGVLMELGDLGITRASFGKALEHSFAKKPKLIPLNLAILEAGAKAVGKSKVRASITTI